MYGRIFLILSIFKIIDCFYLEAASNYLKPRLERNNIVNKGIWVRNKLQDDLFEKRNLGNFIFRPNSADVDHVVQNNFDTFAENNIQEAPFVSNYNIQRNRRSPDHIRKRRPRKSIKVDKSQKHSIEDSVVLNSKIVSDLKPSSVFNEYPYEVAILLNNDGRDVQNITTKRELNKAEPNKIMSNIKSKNNSNIIKEEEEFEVIPLNPNATVSTDASTRSKKFDVKLESAYKKLNNYNMIEKRNNTKSIITTNKQNTHKHNRDVFNKPQIIDWKFRPHPGDKNSYKAVVPKEPKQPKSVTQGGLIKVISMLTKMFRKIMKHHNEINDVHDKLIKMNENFDHRLHELNSKFEDFDSKYSDMIQFNNKIKAFEGELKSQKQYFDIKQKEIQNMFTQFQEQQKKFLTQQRQFYAIQKLMLAQNENINAKQNAIAKTQSEISHKQNNFARILKKAKQMIEETQIKLNLGQFKAQENKDYEHEQTTAAVTVPIPTNTQAMKIDLFAIPTKTKLENQDALIIKEKDEKQIDDLVYKYYFNNTFIDSLMKSKILNNYASSLNSVELVNRSKQSKNKRDQLETTLMVPINNSLSDTPAKRKRRWINHFSKNKYRGLKRHKKTAKESNVNKTLDEHKERKIEKEDQTFNEIKQDEKAKSDPFLAMATNFCNEIGQNANEQVLKWCVEKALRRLKFMEMNAFTPPPTTLLMEKKPNEKQMAEREHGMSTLSTVLLEPVPTILVTKVQEPITSYELVSTKVTPMYAVSNIATQAEQNIFFPDNDELESNLKQYELKPDIEGNVYYDSSAHISDFEHLLADSGATSDIMPGLMDSNSRVEIDPMTFDIQAKRRAYVRRLNDMIMQQMKKRKTH